MPIADVWRSTRLNWLVADQTDPFRVNRGMRRALLFVLLLTLTQSRELIPSLRGTSSHVACMAERVPAGLRPNGEAMRLPTYLYGLQKLTCRRVDSVHQVVETSREPEHLSVGTYVSHVGTSPSWDEPSHLYGAGGKIDDADAAGPVTRAMNLVRATVGDIEFGPVSARIETMSANAGCYKSNFGEGIAIYEKHTVGHHVSHIEHLAIGREADVLRHAAHRQI